MSERDDLMRFAKDLADPDWSLSVPNVAKQTIGRLVAIIEARPRMIKTAAERATLHPGTICMDEHGNAWKRGTGSWVSTGGDTGPLYDEDDIKLTILHEGPQP